MTDPGRITRVIGQKGVETVCWECDRPDARLTDAILPLPSGSTAILRLCETCYAAYYLPLLAERSLSQASGVERGDEAASRPGHAVVSSSRPGRGDLVS